MIEPCRVRAPSEAEVGPSPYFRLKIKGGGGVECSTSISRDNTQKSDNFPTLKYDLKIKKKLLEKIEHLAITMKLGKSLKYVDSRLMTSVTQTAQYRLYKFSMYMAYLLSHIIQPHCMLNIFNSILHTSQQQQIMDIWDNAS